MKSISLCVPFLVLSTKINQSGEMEKHVLTPFGGIDINFRMAVHAAPQRSHYEVDVEGDIEHWMLEADLMNEFKKSLMDFIRGISKECMEYVGCHTEEIRVRFKGTDFDLRTSWTDDTRSGQSRSFLAESESGNAF